MSRKLHGGLKSVVLATMLATAWLAAPIDSAFAVTCSGSSCNNKSPQSTGCAASGVTLRYTYIREDGAGPNLAKVELRSSTVCKTRWSRVTSLIGPLDISTEIERSDGLFYADWDPNATSAYSPMVYVGTSLTAAACGIIENDPNHLLACTNYQ